ncbi:MAG: polysaccharide export protein [Ignavibacteriaceae bacterium]|jgi:polysaccharide export outer membrane protein|nr:polysaccharide export protein [Ignavibacteriaceae bacterium]
MKLFFILTFSVAVFLTSDLSSQQLIPGDGVRLIFLDVTDAISGDYYIQPDGKLQLPFIGIISTVDREFPQLKEEIYTKYDSLYRNPQLTILSLFKISILGEVSKPGYYYVTEEQRLTSILALAGGVTGSANLDNVYIIRNDQEIQLDVETIMQEGDTAIDFGLQSGDQIYVPRSFWADPGRFTWIFTAIATLVTVIAIFFLN